MSPKKSGEYIYTQHFTRLQNNSVNNSTTFRCEIDNCSRILNTKYTFNLKSHINSMHKNRAIEWKLNDPKKNYSTKKINILNKVDKYTGGIKIRDEFKINPDSETDDNVECEEQTRSSGPSNSPAPSIQYNRRVMHDEPSAIAPTYNLQASNPNPQTPNNSQLHSDMLVLSNRKDSCQIFGDFVAEQMRHLSSTRRNKLELMIQQAIISVKLEP